MSTKHFRIHMLFKNQEWFCDHTLCVLLLLLLLLLLLMMMIIIIIIRNNNVVDSSWNVMARSDAREGKWRGNWWMEWVASTLHTTSEHGVSSITTADAHNSAASSRLNWCPRRFKWIRPFRRKTKSGFCACAITFQLVSTPWRNTQTSPRPYLLAKRYTFSR